MEMKKLMDFEDENKVGNQALRSLEVQVRLNGNRATWHNGSKSVHLRLEKM
jgi:hypothetical protein